MTCNYEYYVKKDGLSYAVCALDVFLICRDEACREDRECYEEAEE